MRTPTSPLTDAQLPWVQSTRSLQKRLFKCRITQLCTRIEIPYAQWARWSPMLFTSNQKVVVNIALIQLSK